MPRVKKTDVDINPRPSKALEDWGAYIRMVSKAGPNEKQHPDTGEWGTKCQVLGNMVASGRDEDDNAREVIDDTDACLEMLDCVFKLGLRDRWLLCGYWMHYKKDIKRCLECIPSEPELNPRFRFTSQQLLVDAIDRATFRAESLYRELYHDQQIKRMRMKFERLKRIENQALDKLEKHYGR